MNEKLQLSYTLMSKAKSLGGYLVSGYQRFIAYVYEYRNGKKANNCGFLKVEIQNHTCTVEIHLRVKGMMSKENCKIYGFQRKDGLLGSILMGNCETRLDGMECTVKADARNVGESGVAFGKLGGMILLTESGGFFGTEWDDQPIRPENFKELKQAPKKPVSASENLFDAEPISAPEDWSDKEQDSARKDSINEAPVSHEEAQSPQETPASSEIQLLQETQLQQGAKSLRQVQLRQAVQSSNEIPSESESQSQRESQPAEAASVPTEKDLHIQSAACPEKKETAFLPFGEPFCPFPEGDLSACWKIQPQDLVHFPRRQCVLRNNRFLQYGYYNFGHLLLCKRADGRYILGVPGSYDQQEQFMAGMFGFSCFKESPLIKVKKGRGGYWYRIIDSPVCR